MRDLGRNMTISDLCYCILTLRRSSKVTDLDRSQQIGPQPAPSSFRRSGTSKEYSPVPIGPAVRAPEVKMLGHTHKHRPDYFFPATNHMKSPSEAFNANVLEPFTLPF